MAARKLKLIVVTPERQVVDSDADEVQLPGELGYLGVLPGHTPLVTLLKTGILSYRDGGSAHAMAISSGFAEVAERRRLRARGPGGGARRHRHGGGGAGPRERGGGD